MYRAHNLTSMLAVTLMKYLLLINKVLTFVHNDVFTIATKGCTIRSFPLVTENTKHYVSMPPIRYKCVDDYDKIVDSNNTHIWIADNSPEVYGVFERDLYCCYKNFSSTTSIDSIKYSDCEIFWTVIQARHEFVRVECYLSENKVYDGFFVFTDIAKYYYPETEISDERYNVYILGIESISRINFHRTMSRTANYLDTKGVVDLLGYNNIGSSSFSNLFPMIFGKTYEFISQRCTKNNSFDFEAEVDECSFIWSKFVDAGYYTALGSDSIVGFLKEFEYNLTRAPTDFYFQPFIFEAKLLYKDEHLSYHQCLGTAYTYEIMLNYIEGLMRNSKYRRIFGIFWEGSMSHEDLNKPHIMDIGYLNFLKNLEKNSYLDNTILMFISDHGMRVGPIVNTDEGKLEERLPLFKVLFPDSFKKRYKRAYKNFKENSRRLITSYDVYETLNDLANPYLIEDLNLKVRVLSHSSINKSSLFLPISSRRTCESVGIEKKWCACYTGKRLEETDENREILAEFMVAHINNLLKPHPQCHKLSVKRILSATVAQNGETYTAVVETTPGDGIVDGTVANKEGTWIVSTTMSHNNLYQNHACVADGIAKMYCSCKLK